MQSGRATEKTDVYSFGVLVLEVISGKRPTDASFIEKGLNIVGWVCYVTNFLLPGFIQICTLFIWSPDIVLKSRLTYQKQTKELPTF